VSAVRIFFRWLLWSWLLLIAIPSVLVGILMTESGSAWLLRQVPEMVKPLGIEFAVDGIQGSLLGRLELKGVRAESDGIRFHAGRLLLQWRPAATVNRSLHVQAIELSDVQLKLPVPVESAATALEIPDIVLPMVVQLDRLLLERIVIEQGETRFSIIQTALAAKLDARELSLRELRYSGGGVQLEGALSMQSSAPHTLAGELSVHIDETLMGDEFGVVNANAVLVGPALKPAFDLRLSAPAELRLRGSLNLDQPQPGFDLAAEWLVLNWPLQGPPIVTTQTGHLTLKGVESDYQLELRTKVNGEGIPAGSVNLTGQGDLKGVKLQPLGVSVLDGQITINGNLAWDRMVRWDLEVLADGIDPGRYHPDWPGRINGKMSVSGSLDSKSTGKLTVQTNIHNLGGELRGYEVSASGGLNYQAGELRVKAFALTSGPNLVYLDGRADEHLDLSFDVKAPDLTSLFPGLSGRLEGSGRLQGTPAEPVIQAAVSGHSVVFGDLRTQRFKLDLDWQGNGGKTELQLLGLDAQGMLVNELIMNLAGTPASHRLNLVVKAVPYSGELSASGGLLQRAWEGELDRLSLSEPSLGEWSLLAPASLRLSETMVQFDRVCIKQATAGVCAEGGWSASKGVDLVGGLSDFDLARLSHHLPGAAVIEGELRGEFKLVGTLERPSLSFRLDPGSGRIRIDDDTEPFELAYRNAKITGRFENDRGSADLNFELGADGQAQGRLLLGPEEVGARSLRGKIGASFPDLGLVSGFVPLLERIEGQLQLEAELGGTLAKPQMTGVLQIEGARAGLQAAEIDLSDIELTVRGDGKNPLRVQGQVRSGEGLLSIDGSVDTAASGGPKIDLKVNGEKFQALKLPEAMVEVSPDLRLQGSGPYHLSGSLLIPKALIELKELPSGTVALSKDEVVVGEESAAIRRSGTQNLTARVRIALGEAVKFKGFGLKTELTGAVDARVNSSETNVNGKIELRNGSYKSYGQDLEVERGRLLFAGPPGNPDVDLRAVRLSHDERVKAYLAVNGPLSKPRLRVYSEPAQPDAEALAYLLTGKGLSQAGHSEGVDIASAALSLGVLQGEPLLQQLSDRLGLDELRIETGEDALEDSSLILGEYLSPDLYLGYSQGLFNPVGAVLLRLKLSERLEVESRSGNEQSVDLFYRLEHD